jgi:gingipain R
LFSFSADTKRNIAFSPSWSGNNLRRHGKLFALLGLGLTLGTGLVMLDQKAPRLPGGGQEMLGTMADQMGSVPDPLQPASAARTWVSVNGGPGDPAEIQVTGHTPDRQILEMKLPGFYLQKVEVAGRACSRVEIPGLTPRQTEGLPQVPALAVSLAVPAGGKTVLKIVELKVRRLAVDPVEPSVGHLTRNIDPATVVPSFDPFYEKGGIWPEQTVELSRSFILTGTSGVNVRVNPIRYDSEQGMIEIVEHLVAEVITHGGYSKSLSTSPTQPGQEQVKRSLFANWSDTVRESEKYERLPVTGRMLIVSHDPLVSALDEFADWKRRRGIDVTVVPVGSLGGTREGIAQRIDQMYHESDGLTWVILVGDKAEVPTMTGLYDGSDSDSRYALVDGDDLYPDLFISRFSATNPTELLTMVNRTLRYEREPATGVVSSWYHQAMGVASDEGTPADHKRADALRDDLLAYGFNPVAQVYQVNGATSLDIVESLSKGVSVVNYLGHGSGTGWTSVPFDCSDIALLKNHRSWPWIIDVACSNGDFDRDECFAEAWLRAGTPDYPTGAVAMIAASSLAPWTPPTLMQGEAIDLLVADEASTIGSLFYSGLMKVLDTYSGLDVARQVLEQNVIFGDCSLQVRTKAPSNFLVQDLPELDSDTESWVVEATGPEGAVIALTIEGALLGRGELDRAGRSTVAVRSELTPGQEVTITFTGYNMIPHSETVTVAEDVVGIDPADPEPEPGEGDDLPGVPAHVELLGNYPNPFNPSTTIAFGLPRAMRVQLVIYDVRGNLVRTLVNEIRQAGRNEAVWNGRDRSGRAAASGVYLYQLVTPDGNHTGRMLLTK